MPHIIIDYSANLEDRLDMAALCDHVRRAALETGVFPLAGIRVRALRADHISIADGDGRHGYIDVSVRLRGGRDLPTRKRATARIFAALEAFIGPLSARQPIALSLEMRDIDPELSPKRNTIRDFIERQ